MSKTYFYQEYTGLPNELIENQFTEQLKKLGKKIISIENGVVSDAKPYPGFRGYQICYYKAICE